MERFKNNCYGIVYNSIVHQIPKRKTIGLLKNELRIVARSKDLTLNQVTTLWYKEYELYQNVSKRAFSALRKAEKHTDYQERIKSRSEAAYDALKWNIERPNQLKKACYDVEMSKKYDNSRSELNDLLESGRDRTEVSSSYVFYLCSAHKNPASDHAEWQGRMYYDEKWEESAWTDEERAAIRAYIKNHRLKTVQEIAGYPVYLGTRNNCKHKFTPIGLNEALHNSARRLLEKRGLIFEQSESKSVSESTFDAYKKKLDGLELLWNVAPCEKLGKDILETKKLVQKWSAALRK